MSDSDIFEKANVRDLVSGALAPPAVLALPHRVYIAYRPDSDILYNRFPELKDLSQKWVHGNVNNNGGDLPRLYLLAMNVKHVLADGVVGDIAELGVYKGNSAALLAHYARTNGRTLYLFDTFDGFVPEDFSAQDPNREMGFRDTSVEFVLENTGTEAVECIKGRFPGTLTQEISARSFAIVHIDADLYQPTKAGLDFFYERLSPGGMLIVHDYINEYWGGVKQAVDEFAARVPEQFVLMPDKSGTAILRKNINRT
nr:TylF/MycF/NovP-related O-methyltransferase [uncultured Rhodopila sp.]